MRNDIFELRADDYTISYAGQVIQFLPKEYALLEFLLKHKQRVFTREDLLDQIWGFENPIDRTVDDHIYRLRKKCRDWSFLFTIETVRGKGYRLDWKQSTTVQNPLSDDLLFHEHMQHVYGRYILYGQGDSVRMLYEQNKKLGIQSDTKLSLMLYMLTGDFQALIDSQLPFDELLYYYLHLYFYVQPDTRRVLELYECVLTLKLLPPHFHREIEWINIMDIYLLSGDQKRMLRQASLALTKIEELQLQGYYLPAMINKALISTFLSKYKEAENQCNVIEKQLEKAPYLREKGNFQIVKGLISGLRGDIKVAEARIDEGLDLLKASGFLPLEIRALKIILYVLQHASSEVKLGEELAEKLAAKYNAIWEAITDSYHFIDLKNRLESIFHKKSLLA